MISICNNNLEFVIPLIPVTKYALNGALIRTRKFYIRRNNNKVHSIETGRIFIAHLFVFNL